MSKIKGRLTNFKSNPHYLDDVKLNGLFEDLSSPNEVKDAALEFAKVVRDNTITCPDQTTAIRSIREAVLWSSVCALPDGVTIEDKAKEAFEAYRDSAKGNAVNSGKIPDWEHIGEAIKNNWIAAADAILS